MLNKLSILARKFQFKLAQDAASLDSSLEGGTSGGATSNTAPVSEQDESWKIDSADDVALKNKQYWLIPYNSSELQGKLVEALGAAKKNQNESEIVRLDGMIKGLQQSNFDRITKLFGPNGAVITDQAFIANVQLALIAKLPGADLGTFGTKHNGIDGFWGKVSFGELCKFQVNNDLPETGTLTPQTMSALGIK